MTDTQRVLKLFRESGGREISNKEIVAGQFYGTKGILEYTGRITDARKELRCTCGQDTETCKAVEHIVNIRRNYFVYKSSLPLFQPKPSTQAEPKETEQDIQKRIHHLKVLWTKAQRAGNKQEQIKIETQAKILKMGLRKPVVKNEEPSPPISELAAEVQKYVF